MTVTKSDSLKYLGVYIDSQLNFKEQCKEKCKIAAMNLHYIRQIRQYLTMSDVCHLLVLALVISHLDYGNVIYYGLPKSTLPLCAGFSLAAKMILKKRKYDSVTDVMIALHWLPIPYRSEFKIASLVYQSLKGQAPSYLSEGGVSYNSF